MSTVVLHACVNADVLVEVVSTCECHVVAGLVGVWNYTFLITVAKSETVAALVVAV